MFKKELARTTSPINDLSALRAVVILNANGNYRDHLDDRPVLPRKGLKDVARLWQSPQGVFYDHLRSPARGMIVAE